MVMKTKLSYGRGYRVASRVWRVTEMRGMDKFSLKIRMDLICMSMSQKKNNNNNGSHLFMHVTVPLVSLFPLTTATIIQKRKKEKEKKTISRRSSGLWST